MDRIDSLKYPNSEVSHSRLGPSEVTILISRERIKTSQGGEGPSFSSGSVVRI